MRKLFSVALMAGLLCLVGMTEDAGATVTIDLEWGEASTDIDIGPPTVATCPVANAPCTGSTLRLDIYLSHDLTQGLENHEFSLNFDTALNDDLDLGPTAPVKWAGTDVDPGPGVTPYAPATPSSFLTTRESTLAVAGRINSYESFATTGVLPANGAAYTVGAFTATAPSRYRVGQAFFTFNSVTTDVVSGLFNGSFDQIIDGNSNPVPPGTILFGTATVNVIPEPGTVSLLGLGLVGLVLAGRRSRRS